MFRSVVPGFGNRLRLWKDRLGAWLVACQGVYGLAGAFAIQLEVFGE